jgi:hypothetical protein
MCIAIVSLSDSRIMQLQILIMISVFNLAYLLAVRPYLNPLFNFFEIMNETIVLACMYHLMIFTDFVQIQETLYYAGWSLILLIMIMFFANAILIFCALFHHIKRLCIIISLYARRICLRPKFKIQYNYVQDPAPVLVKRLNSEILPMVEEVSSSLSSEEIEQVEEVKELTPPPIPPKLIEPKMADFLIQHAVKKPKAEPVLGVWKYWAPKNRVFKENEIQRIAQNEDKLERRQKIMKAQVEEQKL